MVRSILLWNVDLRYVKYGVKGYPLITSPIFYEYFCMCASVCVCVFEQSVLEQSNLNDQYGRDRTPVPRGISLVFMVAACARVALTNRLLLALFLAFKVGKK